MRLIDADALLRIAEDIEKYAETIPNNQAQISGMAHITQLIYEAPTIDAEPVVYCRDCKYFESNHEDIEYKPCNGVEWCNNWCGGTTAGGYCREAERREP